MNYQVTFSAPQDITPSGMDGRTLGYPFSYVNETLVGKPEEAANTKEHRLNISISGTLLYLWDVCDDDLMLILFEHAKRQLPEILNSPDNLKSRSIESPMLTTVNQEEKIPFDPSRIPSPDGHTTIIEMPKKFMGFNTDA